MIDILRILFEFGALIVFYMVQFVIYPSLKDCTTEGLTKWYHTNRDNAYFFTLILQAADLITSSIQFFHHTNAYTISSFSVLLLLFVHHFLIIEPKHGKIISGIDSSTNLRKKIYKDIRLRNIVLTLIFGWTLYETIKKANIWL